MEFLAEGRASGLYSWHICNDVHAQVNMTPPEGPSDDHDERCAPFRAAAEGAPAVPASSAEEIAAPPQDARLQKYCAAVASWDDEGRTRERVREREEDDEPTPDDKAKSEQPSPKRRRFTVFRDMCEAKEKALDGATLQRIFRDTPEKQEDPYDIGIEPPGGYPPSQQPYAARARALRRSRREDRDFERER